VLFLEHQRAPGYPGGGNRNAESVFFDKVSEVVSLGYDHGQKEGPKRIIQDSRSERKRRLDVGAMGADPDVRFEQ